MWLHCFYPNHIVISMDTSQWRVQCLLKSASEKIKFKIVNSKISSVLRQLGAQPSVICCAHLLCSTCPGHRGEHGEHSRGSGVAEEASWLVRRGVEENLSTESGCVLRGEHGEADRPRVVKYLIVVTSLKDIHVHKFMSIMRGTQCDTFNISGVNIPTYALKCQFNCLNTSCFHSLSLSCSLSFLRAKINILYKIQLKRGNILSPPKGHFNNNKCWICCCMTSWQPKGVWLWVCLA